METLHPASLFSNSSWLITENKSSIWTKEENKQFESALAIFDDNTPDRWLKVAAMIPGKSVWDVIKQYKELEEDVNDIEAGLFSDPGYLTSPFKLEWVDNGRFDTLRRKSSVTRPLEHERKKGVPWTEDEHRRFLLGLQKHGKGDWRSIARNFVISKSPTQVASHAQKYFLRQLSGGKDKRRPSIHDITTANLTDAIPSDNKLHSVPDQSIVIQSPQNATSITPKVFLDWTCPNSEAIMVFNSAQSDLLKLSQLKLQGQNLYSHSHHGAYLHKVCG
ncbi:hypothetical protein Nepgr_006061 [Nepenthes gracilis]|uniref:Uncharacterized protein n=1 Tax=Nepenthes gracilis TaxID=150966 RepID=A0AAD3S4B2_NEPGR|nr:hypothetical protein Nepgr_006061 [Nepenthes gracilis]